jgi:hypothetical protein
MESFQHLVITGSLKVNGGGITGSLLGSSSYSTTSSYSVTASYSTTASYVIDAGSGFPYSGSAIITGSLLISGSSTIIGNTNQSGSTIISGSQIITGSLDITGSQTISGSVNITGSLLLNGTPVGTGGDATVLVSGSAPSGSSTSGSLWWNNEDGNLYIQSTIRSGSSWVPAVSSVAGGNYGATYRNSYSASVWTVVHNLGTKEPIVQVYSGSQVMIPASIVSADTTTSIITFAGIVSGSVVASTGVGGITSASYALTTPQATSASYALNATSASYALNATSASFALSSSFAAFAHSASFASASNSASFAISSSRTLSSSFATNAVTSSTNTLAYGSIGFSTLPTLTNNDATPSLLSGEGVSISGNTMIIARPGIYLLNANLPFRGNFAEYRWVDSANYQLVGTNLGIAASITGPDPISVSPAAGIVNITAANTIVKLRTGNVSTMGTHVPGYAIATITQLR